MRACVKARAEGGDDDVWWLSVGTKGPVGVDDPRAEGSRWGKE